jgi:hypothetical protein
MDLVARYLSNVRRNLPQAKADDIAAELADDLQSQKEDREASLGRPLTEAETSAMLKSFGHPLVVAGRYRPSQYLIGPDIYPFYAYVMKIVLVIGAALVAGLAALSVVLSQNDIVRAVTRAAGDLWSFFFFALAIVTAIFALLERNGFAARHVANWVPEQLPDPLDRPQSQWNSAFEIGCGIAFLLWWTGLVTIPPIARSGVLIQAAPIWQAYYLPILLLASVQLAVNLVKWLRPRWTRATGVATILICIATLALIAGLHRADAWVVAASTSADPGGAARVAASVNLAIRIAFVAVAAVMLLQLAGEVWKLFRPRPAK